MILTLAETSSSSLPGWVSGVLAVVSLAGVGGGAYLILRVWRSVVRPGLDEASRTSDRLANASRREMRCQRLVAGLVWTLQLHGLDLPPHLLAEAQALEREVTFEAEHGVDEEGDRAP